MMHGEIWCESELGQGTEFSLTAEFALADDNIQTCHQMSAREQDAADALKGIIDLKPILLVEDNEINQIIAEEMLKHEGYKVDIASNGQEAIDKLLGGDYALVLMDIQMPVMDGITATHEIRKFKRFKDLPIVAMTAHAMSGDFEKSLQAGMNDHVTKPIEPELLYKTLAKWMKTRG
jgi:two-component system sensor histidine kinase/response regulator